MSGSDKTITEVAQGSSQGSVPVPDPTLLTTVQLNREVASLKENLLSLINSKYEIIATRLEGMDKALSLFQGNIERVPTDTDKQVSHLKELHDERFKGIEIQFRERDTRSQQSAEDSKVRVDAAFAAAKEAGAETNKRNDLSIAKSEAATIKQMDSLAAQMDGKTKAFEDKIDDIKERLSMTEGKGRGSMAAHQSQQTSASFMVAVVVAAISFLGLVVMVIDRVK